MPVLIFPSNVVSTRSWLAPARLSAAVVEKGAISTVPPPGAVMVLAAFSVRLSAISEIRPPLPAVSVAGVPAPRAMVSPAWVTWKNRLLAE